MKEANITAALV